jgi:phosphohistidine phosphatase SixA
MKTLLFLLFVTVFFAFGAHGVQAREITVILLRHAEKDTSPAADKVNPNLSEAGLQRAERLVGKLKGYKPNEIFASNFIRTKQTATPLAREFGLPVHLYDHKNLQELYDLILTTDKRVFVIVGHNNTTPALANMLIKQEKYQALAETEYNKIFVIKIKNGNVTDQVMEY